MGNFQDFKQYIMGQFDAEQLIYQYLDDASKVYLTQYEDDTYDEAGHLKLNVLRNQIMKAVNKTNPVELSQVYSQLMSSNMPRIKKVEDFGCDATNSELAVWKADTYAFLDVIGIVADRRYDYNSASFVEDGKNVIDNPVDMVEELAEFATHNDRIKRTASQDRALSGTLLDMETEIDIAIADMTSRELEDFKRQMLLRKVAYDNALSRSMYDVEYCNYYDLSTVSPIIRATVSVLLSLQKEYNTDMIRKYSDRRYGLIPFVENIDKNIDCAILGE